MKKSYWKEINGRMLHTESGDSYPIFESVPAGWHILLGALTAPRGFEWCNNGKSRFGKEYEAGFVRVGGGREYE